MKNSLSKLLGLIALLSITVSAGLGSSTQAREPQSSASVYPVINLTSENNADTPASQAKASHRLIVELESPALAAWAKGQTGLYNANGRLNVKSAAAQNYINKLKAEQNTFIASMQKNLPGSKVSTFVNELNQAEQNRYQVVFNGMAVETGNLTQEEAIKTLESMPGVKSVSLDYAHSMDLHASNDLIGSPAVWTSLGGRSNAGAGIKLASMDGGVHKDGPMFSGAGYSWPSDIPSPGLGDIANNNGKIVVSRKYFRPWDMPSAGDENPWPGTQGTSHGVHTAGIAAGNVVTATYLGLDVPNMSGVAPRAWIMSYRVFYNSVTNDGSFYNAEGIAALEDILLDNADVVNNSWGGGPSSAGGEYDALDTALLNVAQGGTFVAMSAGNAGPGLGTTDHPSDAYINVAATTTDRNLASGRFYVTQPATATIPVTLTDIAFSTASFGTALAEGQTFDYSMVVPSTQPDGCDVSGQNPWPAGTFTGKGVMIIRGTCEFGTKVLNAQQAGAAFVVVYNHATGGNGLINMGPGVEGGAVTIPSIFIGNTAGLGMKDWITAHPSNNMARVDTTAFFIDTDADVLATFSSHGPGVGDVLKPDIAAPGVNILSQGYTTGAIGEARHLGYGQASGTSMAAPHVAGAAALLRQMYPTWTNADIKSAMMTTAKYLEVYDSDGSPAQPLAMGAGRLDIDAATDPGVIVSPPSLSFSKVMTGTNKSITVNVRNITNATETYAISTLYTGDGFDQTTTLPGFSVSPASLTLAPGETKSFVVTFNSLQGQGYGDNQGYIVLDGSTHEAHLAAWARVTYSAPIADVLVIDNDLSSLPIASPPADYLSYYTDALDELGYTYDVWDADAEFGNQHTIPDATTLMGYKAVVYFTGDNFQPNGTFTVATPLTELDQNELTQYANSGGTVIAMGQDLSAVLNSDDPDDTSFFYGFILGADWAKDSVTAQQTPTLDIVDSSFAAPEFADVAIDLSETGDGAHNQFFNDELNYITKDPTDDDSMVSNVPFLRYPYTTDVASGTVGMLHREQPTLERDGITYWGRSAYTTFGLEGVNDADNKTSRAELLNSMLEWAWDDVTAVVTATVSEPNPEVMVSLEAAITSEFGEGYTYRWDFGDGSPYTAPSQSPTTTHSYPVMANGMTYVIRLEATDSYGNKTVVPTTITVGDFRLFTPIVRK